VAAGSWLEWWTAERLVALAAVGQLVVLVAAARYSRRQVDEARELREAEARRREAEARPHVIIDLEPERPPFIYLVVTNVAGRWPAMCGSRSIRPSSPPRIRGGDSQSARSRCSPPASQRWHLVSVT